MIRKVYFTLGLLVVIGLLAACAQPGAAPPAPTAKQPAQSQPTAQAATAEAPVAADAISQIEINEPVTITFWHAQSGSQEEEIKNLIAEFEQEYPNITVEPVLQGGYGDLRQATLAAIAAGDPPDLAIAYGNMVSEYYKEDVVVDLDPYVNSEKYGLTEADFDDIYPAFIQGDRYPQFGGQMLSFPPARSVVLLYYNQDWLTELGYDGPPETWADFKEMACAATEDTDGDGEPDKWGYAYRPEASQVVNWIFSEGGDLLGPDGKTVVFKDEVTDFLTFLQDVFQSGCAYEVAEAFGDQSDFAVGKALFAFSSIAGLPYYDAAVKDEATGEPRFDWSVTPMPVKEAGMTPTLNMYGPSITVFQSTPEKQLASWLFIKWWSDTEQTAQWATTTNYFPVRRSAAESEAMQTYFEDDPRYAKAFSFLQDDNIKTEPNNAAWNAVRDMMANAETGVINGTQTPEEAAADLVEQANAAFAE